MDSYIKSEIPVATTVGSVDPEDAVILCFVRYVSMSFALHRLGVKKKQKNISVSSYRTAIETEMHLIT